MSDIISKIKAMVHKYDKRAIVEIPPQIEFGHVATNLPVFLKNIQEFIDDLLNCVPHVMKVEQRGMFLNIFLSYDLLKSQDIVYIKSNDDCVVNLEFASPNPTGPLHLGHLRNIIIGDSLYKLLKLCRVTVKSEMYINDQGNQMDQFVQTIGHYKDPNRYPNVFYKGDYVKDIAEQVQYPIKDDIVSVVMKNVKNTLNNMSVFFDGIVYESSLYDILQEVIEILKNKNLVTEGYLENQKSEGVLLLLNLMDEQFVLRRSNGEFTYFAFDIAYFYSKYKRGFNQYICVLGEDHYGHIKKLTQVLAFLNIDLKCVRYAMVNVVKDNEQIKMSKREGNVITLDYIIKQIEINEIKCQILKQNYNKVLNLQLDNQDLNMFFYIKYVYDRIVKILYDHNDENDGDDLNINSEVTERLFVYLMHYQHMISSAIVSLDVHRVFDFSYQIIQLAYEYLTKEYDHKGNHLLLLKVYNVIMVLNIMMSLNLSGSVGDRDNDLFSQEFLTKDDLNRFVDDFSKNHQNIKYTMSDSDTKTND